MYTVRKKVEVAGSHSLQLNYPSPCCNIHGHNWIITVEVEASQLDENGMVVDFKILKNMVHKLDHAHLNEVLGNTNPTAENIAKWLCVQLNTVFVKTNKEEMERRCIAVTVQESEGNVACYTL